MYKSPQIADANIKTTAKMNHGRRFLPNEPNMATIVIPNQFRKLFSRLQIPCNSWCMGFSSLDRQALATDSTSTRMLFTRQWKAAKKKGKQVERSEERREG